MPAARSLSRPVRRAALAALALHTLAVLWIWRGHSPGARALILFWADFPVSLAYAGVQGRGFLAASLLAGGALWSTVAALLAHLLGRLARRA